MPLLQVSSSTGSRSIAVPSGTSVRAILDTTDLRVRSGCRGNGTCGLCLIQIKGDRAPEPTRAERLQLTPDQLRQGMRLACQVVPSEDLQIRIIHPAAQSDWRSLAAEEYYRPDAARDLRRPTPAQDHSALGVAIDLGTTHINLTLWDLRGRRLTGRSGLNPQAAYGGDVMTRLVAASESPDHAHDLSGLVLDAIGQAILDICSREAYNPSQITRVAIVGNTPQLALLSGNNYASLLRPEFWTRELSCQPASTWPWCGAWNIDPGAHVVIAAPLAGFVGSDLLAGVLATEMTRQSEVSLLIDFGTNTEIALWDGALLWVTSAAGGPAFEGSGLGCGVPAGPGAIYQVESGDAPESLTFTHVPGAAPQGLCGSGLVDLMACLLRTEKLSPRGKFAGGMPGEAYVFRAGSGDLALTLGDVDLFQRAKAAIGTGIRCTLSSAGLAVRDLAHVYVAGAFGRFLNVRNAIAIGLLPDLDAESIAVCGNTALAGCEMLLACPERQFELEWIRKHARLFDLSNAPQFDELYLHNLFLRPMVKD